MKEMRCLIISHSYHAAVLVLAKNCANKSVATAEVITLHIYTRILYKDFIVVAAFDIDRYLQSKAPGA